MKNLKVFLVILVLIGLAVFAIYLFLIPKKNSDTDIFFNATVKAEWVPYNKKPDITISKDTFLVGHYWPGGLDMPLIVDNTNYSLNLFFDPTLEKIIKRIPLPGPVLSWRKGNFYVKIKNPENPNDDYNDLHDLYAFVCKTESTNKLVTIDCKVGDMLDFKTRSIRNITDMKIYSSFDVGPANRIIDIIIPDPEGRSYHAIDTRVPIEKLVIICQFPDMQTLSYYSTNGHLLNKQVLDKKMKFSINSYGYSNKKAYDGSSILNCIFKGTQLEISSKAPLGSTKDISSGTFCAEVKENETINYPSYLRVFYDDEVLYVIAGSFTPLRYEQKGLSESTDGSFFALEDKVLFFPQNPKHKEVPTPITVDSGLSRHEPFFSNTDFYHDDETITAFIETGTSGQRIDAYITNLVRHEKFIKIKSDWFQPFDFAINLPMHRIYLYSGRGYYKIDIPTNIFNTARFTENQSDK